MPPLILTHPQPYPEGSRPSGWKRNPSSPAPGAPSYSSWPVWDPGEGQPQGVRRPRACPPDTHCPPPGSLTSALCSLCTNSSGGVPVTFMISFSWSRSAAGQGHSMARPGAHPPPGSATVSPCPVQSYPVPSKAFAPPLPGLATPSCNLSYPGTAFRSASPAPPAACPITAQSWPRPCSRIATPPAPTARPSAASTGHPPAPRLQDTVAALEQRLPGDHLGHDAAHRPDVD